MSFVLVAIVAAIVAAIVVTALYAIAIYNNLVRLKHGVTKAWANIDVLLKQRHDELPKLIEACKQHMSYERETLEAVVDARARVFAAASAGDVAQTGQAEGLLRMGLGRLFAVAEQYPELKANASFLHLQSRISGLEETIADRREFYNDSVNALNVRLEQFPDVFIARAAGHQPAELLTFSEAETRDVDIRGAFDA